MRQVIQAVKMGASKLRGAKMKHHMSDERQLTEYDEGFYRTPLEEKLLGPARRPAIRRRVDVILQSRRLGRH